PRGSSEPYQLVFDDSDLLVGAYRLGRQIDRKSITCADRMIISFSRVIQPMSLERRCKFWLRRASRKCSSLLWSRKPVPYTPSRLPTKSSRAAYDGDHECSA